MKGFLKNILLFVSAFACLACASACENREAQTIEMRQSGSVAGLSGELYPSERSSAEDSSQSAQHDHSDQGEQSAQEWLPEIIDFDEPYVFGSYDDTTKYDYSADKLTFVTANGGFTSAAGNGVYPDYTTSAAYSLAIGKGAPLPYGTLSCDVKTVSGSDTGLIFALTTTGDRFWEGQGISFYNFFISQGGYAYLGKAENGKWTMLTVKSMTFNTTDFYNLKVVYKNYSIYCFINGVQVLNFKEVTPLKGTGFGFRSSKAGAVFKNIVVSSDYIA